MIQLAPTATRVDVAKRYRKRENLRVKILNRKKVLIEKSAIVRGQGSQTLYLKPHMLLVLNLLDGKRTCEEIRELLATNDDWPFAFDSDEAECEFIAQVITKLVSVGLAVSAHSAIKAELLEKGVARQSLWQRIVAWPIAVEVPLLRSDSFIQRRYLQVGHLMVSNLAIALSLLLWLIALPAFIGAARTFGRELSDFGNFLTPQNAISIFLAMTIVKSLHEFGHAFWAKRWGCAVDEMGLLFILGAPCFYCTVSRIEFLDSKWKKISIALGGVYVELTLASLATFVWLWTAPGFIHYLALAIIFIASVHTLLFNLFPLLRYDGYYALAFYWGRDNLRAEAGSWVKSVFAYLLSGDRSWIENDDSHEDEDRSLLFVMGVLTSVYGWFIMFNILRFLYLRGEAYGSAIGLGCLAFGAWYLLFRPLLGLYRFLSAVWLKDLNATKAEADLGFPL